MAVLFAPSVRLTKGEVFSACQALADADRCLVRAGRTREAGALGDLFELLEARMVADDPRATDDPLADDPLADDPREAGARRVGERPAGLQSPEGS